MAARAALGAGLAVALLSITIDGVYGARTPDLAARWGIGSAATSAARANRLAQPGASPLALANADGLARHALTREPASVAAVRALGQVAGLRGDLGRADRRFRYAEKLSRRDLLTQVWLIEERVRHGDVPGALTHYDRALRTVGRARAVLFPVLVPAMSAPHVARAAERLMAARTAWGPDFLAVMAQSRDASPDALGKLALAARLRADVAGERGPLDAVLLRLVEARRYAAARAVWNRALGLRHTAMLVRDGGFEADPALAPFDWSFTNTGDLSATREPGNAGTALVLRTANGGAGELARQLLMLRPGAYRLALTSSGAGTDPIARAAAVVTCASGGPPLGTLPLSVTAQARLSSAFTVPVGCGAQVLAIVAPAGLGEGNPSVFVDDMTIVPFRR